MFDDACFQELSESLQVAVRDVYDFLADVDAVVAIHFLNLVNGDDIRPMDAQETVFGQHVLYGFHRQMCDERLWLVVEIVNSPSTRKKTIS